MILRGFALGLSASEPPLLLGAIGQYVTPVVPEVDKSHHAHSSGPCQQTHQRSDARAHAGRSEDKGHRKRYGE